MAARGFDRKREAGQGHPRNTRPWDKDMEPLLDVVKSIARAVLSMSMHHGQGPPMDKEVYVLAMSYINQLERDGDIEIDAGTGKMVQGLENEQYQGMEKRFEEWMTMVEQSSRVGKMETKEELAKVTVLASRLLNPQELDTPRTDAMEGVLSGSMTAGNSLANDKALRVTSSALIADQSDDQKSDISEPADPINRVGVDEEWRRCVLERWRELDNDCDMVMQWSNSVDSYAGSTREALPTSTSWNVL